MAASEAKESSEANDEANDCTVTCDTNEFGGCGRPNGSDGGSARSCPRSSSVSGGSSLPAGRASSRSGSLCPSRPSKARSSCAAWSLPSLPSNARSSCAAWSLPSLPSNARSAPHSPTSLFTTTPLPGFSPQARRPSGTAAGTGAGGTGSEVGVTYTRVGTLRSPRGPRDSRSSSTRRGDELSPPWRSLVGVTG